MTARVLLPIGPQLRLVALGIECAHGIGLVQREIQRVFDDARADASGDRDCRAKRYVFRCVGGVEVSGVVDEHEPESIWIVVEGHPGLERDLPRLLAAAETCAAQLARDRAGSEQDDEGGQS